MLSPGSIFPLEKEEPVTKGADAKMVEVMVTKEAWR
jgi:hypothetical protein